jgi:hypothetical protein
VSYLPGYRPDEKEYLKNKLVGWQAVKSEEKLLEVQLEFLDPIFVASAEVRCRVKVCFGDGSLFKSAGFAIPVKNKTCKIYELLP